MTKNARSLDKESFKKTYASKRSIQDFSPITVSGTVDSKRVFRTNFSNLVPPKKKKKVIIKNKLYL